VLLRQEPRPVDRDPVRQLVARPRAGHRLDADDRVAEPVEHPARQLLDALGEQIVHIASGQRLRPLLHTSTLHLLVSNRPGVSEGGAGWWG
jgi:hypothetical protein